MATYKLVNADQLDSDLTAVGNAIRSKGGTSAGLSFPAGMVSAIGAISTGVELNFDVVGGTSQPRNPKENTIWVNTRKTITDWVFSATQPTAASGRVWISTGESSNVEFNALKKNGIQVYPLSAKQYISGAWAYVTAKSYQGGEWVAWITKIFESGVGAHVPLSTYKESNASVTIGTDTITMKATSGTSYMAAFWTTDKKDMSKHKTLYVDAALVNHMYPGGNHHHKSRCYVWDRKYSSTISSSNTVPDFYTLFTADSVRRVYALDISAVTGEMYVGVYGNPTTLTIYDMWLE